MKKIILTVVAAVLATGLISFEKNLEAQSSRSGSRFGAPQINPAANINNAARQGAQNINGVPNAGDVTRPVGGIVAFPFCPDGEATYPSSANVLVQAEVADGVIIPFRIHNDQNPFGSATASAVLQGRYGSDGLGSIADFVPSSDSRLSSYLVPRQEFILQGSSNSRVHNIDIGFIFTSGSRCPDRALLRVRSIQSGAAGFGVDHWSATQSQSAVLVGVAEDSLGNARCSYNASIDTTPLFADYGAGSPGRALVPIEFCAANATHVWKNRFQFVFSPEPGLSTSVKFDGGAKWYPWRNDTFSRPEGSSSDVY